MCTIHIYDAFSCTVLTDIWWFLMCFSSFQSLRKCWHSVMTSAIQVSNQVTTPAIFMPRLSEKLSLERELLHAPWPMSSWPMFYQYSQSRGGFVYVCAVFKGICVKHESIWNSPLPLLFSPQLSLWRPSLRTKFWKEVVCAYGCKLRTSPLLWPTNSLPIIKSLSTAR